MIKITECPRDAMQGIKEQIPSEIKAGYLNELLKVGFDTLDFGSFVSEKAIPQMKDTEQVLKQLELTNSKSQLLAIVANYRGAQQACDFQEISFLGFPFSISETFQQRNANSSIAESFKRVEDIQALCAKNKKKLLIYISMAFGNPYGDKWNPEIAINWSRKMNDLGIKHLALADTTGSSNKQSIAELFSALLPELKGINIAAHLHSTPQEAKQKIKAAYDAGCRSFDVAIHGFGGCPMASDKLTGNIATQKLEEFASENNFKLQVDIKQLHKCYDLGWNIFSKYH